MELRAIGRREAEAVGIDRHIELTMDLREITREERLIAPRFELLPLRRFRAIEVRIELVERSEFCDQCLRPLLSDAGNAGDVVDRIAPDRHDIDDLFGLDTKRFFHAGSVVHDLASGVVEADPFADELEKILVRSDDHDLVSRLARLAGERADHVVGLVLLTRDDRNSEALDDLADVRNLRREVVRHRLAVFLVVGELFEADGRSTDVESDRDRVRLVFLEQLPQHLNETVDGIRCHARRVRKLPNRVVAAIHVVRAIDQIERRFCSHREGDYRFGQNV
jgi:hypothetical protein